MSATFAASGPAGPRIVEENWGYAIGTGSVADGNTPIFQSLSGGAGLVAVTCAALIWVLPGAFMGEDVMMVKMVVSALMAVSGIFLLWYASTGTDAEIHVDLRKKLLRRMLRNQKGQAREVEHFNFNDFTAIRIGTDPHNSGANGILLYHKDLKAHIPIVSGDEAVLEDLMERLRRDMAI